MTAFRDLISTLADTLGGMLPDRAWRLIWKTLLRNDRLIKRDGWHYMGEMASRMKVDRIGVDGDYGNFLSSPSDTYILKDYASFRKWAGPTNSLILDFFAQGKGTYLDVGANIGMTVVPVSALPNVDCFAFEPEPTNFRNLMSNIRENCAHGNVRASQIALFDRNSTIAFEIAEKNLGDHRIRLGTGGEQLLNEDHRRTIAVPCSRLDDLHIPVTNPLFVKIDTQGAEPFIVAGGIETLAKADTILLEWSPYLMRRMSGDPSIIIDFLSKHFSEGAINQSPTEEGFVPAFMPILALCDVLSKSLSGFTGMTYVDVLVRK